MAPRSALLSGLFLLAVLNPTFAQVNETMFEFARNWTPGATEDPWQVDDLLDLLGGEWNLPPYVISIPPETVRFGKEYLYHIEVADPEGDGVVYEFLEAPNGMTIGPTGEVRWTPTEISHATVERRFSRPVIQPEFSHPGIHAGIGTGWKNRIGSYQRLESETESR